MDSFDKFNGKSDFYQKARPDYSGEFIHYMFSDIITTENAVIADIGSGTGKFSKEFITRGYRTYCVEPGNDMRKTAQSLFSQYGNYLSVNGDAQNTSLKSHSIDIITAAQAFHWFDTEKFRKECIRILKPDGIVILVWNSRIPTAELNIHHAEIMKKYCPGFYGFSGGDDTIPKLVDRFFEGHYSKKVYDNYLHYTKDMFLNINNSKSYSLDSNDINYKAFTEKISELFDRYSENGILTVPDQTIAYWGKL